MKAKIEYKDGKAYYRWWEIVDSMPEGYYIDKLAPSPLFGHVFIVNAPVLKGSNRKLLKLKEHEIKQGNKSKN